MMGEQTVAQEALFYEFSLERHVPSDHLLRAIDGFVDLSGLREHLRPYYSDSGSFAATLFLVPGMEIEQIIGSTGDNQLRIHGSEYTQTIIGENNHDILWSGGGTVTLTGRGGNDIYHLSSGRETIIEAAGGGTDSAFVSADYALNAGAHVETISTYWQYGNEAIDITGNEVGQTIIGNFGSNFLDGRGGGDTLIGLGGADIYGFTTALEPGNIDRIIEFSSGVDTIALDDAVFGALSPGQLPAGAFSIGTAATEADDRIIYNPETGQLFYDPDGFGWAAAIQFAVLHEAPPLQAYDFLVI